MEADEAPGEPAVPREEELPSITGGGTRSNTEEATLSEAATAAAQSLSDAANEAAKSLSEAAAVAAQRLAAATGSDAGLGIPQAAADAAEAFSEAASIAANSISEAAAVASNLLSDAATAGTGMSLAEAATAAGKMLSEAAMSAGVSLSEAAINAGQGFSEAASASASMSFIDAASVASQSLSDAAIGGISFSGAAAAAGAAASAAGIALPEGLVWPESWHEGMDAQEVCAEFLKTQLALSSWLERRPWLLFLLFLLLCEGLRYVWHRILFIALNYRRHTPPRASYAMTTSFEEHASFVEKIFCDRPDHDFCVEGLFLGRTPLKRINREMLEEAMLAHLAMEVRRWYSMKHHEAADRIIDTLEALLSRDLYLDKPLHVTSGLRLRTPSGGSIAAPIAFDDHPEDARKPFMYIGEQRLQAYFKPLPIQCLIWAAKTLKTLLLWRWGFRLEKYGPVQMWVREPPPARVAANGKPPSRATPLLFCPGLWLGNTAYLRWIQVGLLPLGEARPLLLLELPHLSHGINPRKAAYALRYSWPRADEICDAVANCLVKFRSPADIVGNSFGTVVMTMLRVDHRNLFRRFVYIDPVCFPACYPGPTLATSAPYLDGYCALLRQALMGLRWPRPQRLFKYLILRPCIFGDLEVQYVMKRGLYVHEASERGSLGAESLVVIGRNDELLHNPPAVAEWVERQWPEATVKTVDYNHGVMMGFPRLYAKLMWEFLAED